jgi:bla regulator protein blaR1
VLLQHEAVPGPLTCGLFTPTILVPADAANWDACALQRALVHEVEHVRRHDWVTHCGARAVCALYWFHPLVWIAWRHLRVEAERSCDDAVVVLADAREYASLLITVAQRQVSDAGLPILAMASRGDLSVRVAALLNRQQRRGGVTRACVGVAFVVAMIVASAVSAVTFAQTTPPAPVTQPLDSSFEVVSIKRNIIGDEDMVINAPDGTAYNTKNVALLGTLMRAYQVKNVSDAPDWLANERYDITAKAAGKPTFDQVTVMLRTMLKERMKLKAHIEPRETPVYALVVAKPNHPGLQRFPHDCTAILADRDAAMKAGQPLPPPGANGALPCGYTWSGAINSGGITMARLAGLLDWVAGRVVLDRTGLSGPYEFTLRFVSPGAPAGEVPDDRPSLFTALPEQLGLKLEPTRAPIDTLVIDHIERPTEN